MLWYGTIPYPQAGAHHIRHHLRSSGLVRHFNLTLLLGEGRQSSFVDVYP